MALVVLIELILVVGAWPLNAGLIADVATPVPRRA